MMTDTSPGGVEQGYKEYITDRFSFLYPANWELCIPDSGDSVFIHKLPSAFIKLSVLPNNANNDFFKNLERRTEELYKELDDLELIHTRDLRIRDMSAKEIKYSFKKNYLIGKREIVVSSLFIEKGRSVFLIDYQSLGEKHEKFLHVYDKVKDSLRFLD